MNSSFYPTSNKKTFLSLRKTVPSTFNKVSFDRSLLPRPLEYYQQELPNLKNRGEWSQALCCFHQERHPSLSLNIKTGAYRCFACGAHGGDILAFQMERYGQSFKEAAQTLGAWRIQP